jgi:hypothetical protein
MGKRGPKPNRDKVIWTPEMAYAVGLLVTDGSLSIDGRHIDLTSKDEEQLINFMNCIGKKIRISSKKPSPLAEPITRVQFSDVGLYHFLEDIGLTPNKTKTVGEIKVPDEYFFDFLRGHHDGDGAFYSYYDPRWKSSFMYYLIFLSASKAHVLWIQNKLEIHLGVKGHITTSRSSCVVQLKYAKRESLVVLRKMYPNKDVVCLSRKRLKIERALGIVSESL